MNKAITANFSKMRITYFILPILLLLLIFTFLFIKNALNQETYVLIQKNLFLNINKELSQYPLLMHNLTYLGDGLILLSFLTLFIFYAPKLWEPIITSFIISGIFTGILKPLFSIKRPSASILNDHFNVIGPTLTGSNSFPSGHSITVFTILTVILFGFMPTKTINKIQWSVCICVIGVGLISTRIAVGAHHPLDVTTGAIIGYISAISGILINKKLHIWSWIGNRKFYPIFIVLFITCIIIISSKILDTNLIIFYLAILSLTTSLYILSNAYFKKKA